MILMSAHGASTGLLHGPTILDKRVNTISTARDERIIGHYAIWYEEVIDRGYNVRN